MEYVCSYYQYSTGLTAKDVQKYAQVQLCIKLFFITNDEFRVVLMQTNSAEVLRTTCSKRFSSPALRPCTT